MEQIGGGWKIVVVFWLLLLLSMLAYLAELDLGANLLLLLSAPFLLVITLIASIGFFRRKQLRSVYLLVVAFPLYLFSAYLIVRDGGDAARTWIKWLLHSQQYKAEVEQSIPHPGKYPKHIVWDQWGWAGIGDSEEYLVHDPSDSLRNASSAAPIESDVLPCQAIAVHRLGRGWYTARFYADSYWEDCGNGKKQKH